MTLHGAGQEHQKQTFPSRPLWFAAKHLSAQGLGADRECGWPRDSQEPGPLSDSADVAIGLRLAPLMLKHSICQPAHQIKHTTHALAQHELHGAAATDDISS